MSFPCTDNIDLQIIRLLARDCRNPYSKIASIVGMTPNAVKERVNKMVSNGTIRSFVLRINPAVLGYERGCILIIRDIDKTANKQDIINKINLIGDIHTYAKQLGGASVFLLAVRAGAEDKIVILTDMLKPAAVTKL